MERNIQPDTEFTEKIKNIAERIDRNMRDAIFSLAILECGNQSTPLRESLDNTYEAHSYNMISVALQNEVILCFSRLLEDGGEDRFHLVHALSILSQGNNLKHLHPHTSFLDYDAFLETFQNCRAKINKIRSKKKYKEAIIEYRNNYLAHSLSKNRQYQLKYKTLSELLTELIEPITTLLSIMDGVNRDFKELQNINGKYADDFWNRVQGHSFPVDSKHNWQSFVIEAVKRRKEQKLTQEQLAVLAGVSKPTLNSFEQGKTNIKLDSALKILKVLGLA